MAVQFESWSLSGHYAPIVPDQWQITRSGNIQTVTRWGTIGGFMAGVTIIGVVLQIVVPYYFLNNVERLASVNYAWQPRQVALMRAQPELTLRYFQWVSVPVRFISVVAGSGLVATMTLRLVSGYTGNVGLCDDYNWVVGVVFGCLGIPLFVWMWALRWRFVKFANAFEEAPAGV
ncbi:hypothetical protein HK100_000899 [Physocladia obscura]|uniref:Uncharacterized protein n=1 Tax=Physocladia obscura TaxID=109957 RepID=A0AAD5XC77_9FUNG|nr:hypothetical protein HK100_000899 [Physocladia obscura]